MRAYQQDDLPAFETLYARHAGRVLGYLKGRLRSETDALDVLQITFLKLHQSRHRYDPDFPFLPWLFTICRHALVDWVRARKPTQALDSLVLTAPTPEADTVAQFQGVLETLQAQDQQMLRLRFEQGFSFEQLAARLGISSVAARKRMGRLVARLRRAREDEHG